MGRECEYNLAEPGIGNEPSGMGGMELKKTFPLISTLNAPSGILHILKREQS